MRKSWLVAASCILVSSISFAQSRESALKSLELAKKQLVKYQQESANLSLPANELIKLIVLAEARGLTHANRIVPVGYSRMGPNGELSAGGEFGSSSSSWRIGGGIQATPEVLQVSVDQVENGNSWVHVHVRTSQPVNFFGLNWQEFNATLMVLKTKGTARLTLRLGDRSPDHIFEDKRHNDEIITWRREHQREYKFSLDSGAQAPQSWNDLSFKIQPSNVHMMVARRKVGP